LNVRNPDESAYYYWFSCGLISNVEGVKPSHPNRLSFVIKTDETNDPNLIDYIEIRFVNSSKYLCRKLNLQKGLMSQNEGSCYKQILQCASGLEASDKSLSKSLYGNDTKWHGIGDPPYMHTNTTL
jgi:hypothetical protein